MTITKARLNAVVYTLALLALTLPSDVFGDTFDFGGNSEKFGGGGDKTPPRCSIDLPLVATSPFFIKWNCTDDVSPRDEIRSELWILRPGAPTSEKLKDFLGFPASIFVDESILQVTNFSSGLPASFRLVARDRAGIAAISSSFTVLAQDNSVDNCDLSIITEDTESTGSTTGMPSMTVSATNVTVTTQQVGSAEVRIFTPSKVTAETCEIDSLCSDDNRLLIDSSIVLEDQTGTTGTQAAIGSVTVTPGNLLANVGGTTNVADGVLTTVEVTGAALIDGVIANITLSCSQ